MIPKLSHFGWSALAQLAQGPCHDGDIVSKPGHRELIERGLATRGRRCHICKLSLNELTAHGAAIAAHMPIAEWVEKKDWLQ